MGRASTTGQFGKQRPRNSGKPNSNSAWLGLGARYLAKALLLWTLGSGIPLMLAAQVRALASFDRSSVEAGDTAVLRVQVSGVQAAPQRVNMAVWLPALAADDIRPPSPWRRIGEYWVQTMAIVLLDTGCLTFPPLPVVLQVGDPVLTNPLAITVTAPHAPANLEAMAPIRDIYRQPTPLWYDYWPAAAILALAAAFWLWRERRKRTSPPSPAPSQPPRPSPTAIALQKLETLAREKPWTQSQRIGEYYAALSWIVREFLEQEYKIPALEQTTAEIACNLEKTSFPEPLRPDVQRLLQQADWVKFADAQPPEKYHEQWLHTARRICETQAPETKANEKTPP